MNNLPLGRAGKVMVCISLLSSIKWEVYEIYVHDKSSGAINSYKSLIKYSHLHMCIPCNDNDAARRKVIIGLFDYIFAKKCLTDYLNMKN